MDEAIVFLVFLITAMGSLYSQHLVNSYIQRQLIVVILLEKKLHIYIVMIEEH